MPLTLPELLRQLSIPFDETEGAARGWLHTRCPWCGHQHLGWPVAGSRSLHCFFCGKRERRQALAVLAGIPETEAGRLLMETRGAGGVRRRTERKTLRGPRRHSAVEPPNLGVLAPAHLRYLESRLFEPRALERSWGIGGIGPHGLLWRWRVWVPVTRKGRTVTWQARGISKEQDPKYLACLPEWEAAPIKSCLYGLDQALATGRRRCVVVEGVTDVWRLGPGAVATFGVGFSAAQRSLLARSFEGVAVLRDPGRMEWVQAERLALELHDLGLEAEAVSLLPECGDPGSLPDEEAGRVMKELLGRP